MPDSLENDRWIMGKLAAALSLLRKLLALNMGDASRGDTIGEFKLCPARTGAARAASPLLLALALSP